MKFIHRLGFYLGGFSIGLIFLMFFLSGKKTSCSYFPNARIIKNISAKKIIFSPEIIKDIVSFKIDTNEFYSILKNSKIKGRFENNNIDKCKLYTIESNEHVFKINNCKNSAEVKNILKKK
jgi:hypothetical protein